MSEQLNGIDNVRLFKMMEAIKQKPSLADFIFRVNTTWMNGGHSRSVIKGFYGAEKEDDLRTTPFIFEIDQPAALLGEDIGPTAVEYLLNALAGCLTNSIVCLASARGITLKDIESEIEGRFDLRYMFGLSYDKGNPIDDIKIKLRIKGQDLSSEEKKFICELGRKTSLVYKIVTTPFPVEILVEDEICSEENNTRNYYRNRK